MCAARRAVTSSPGGCRAPGLCPGCVSGIDANRVAQDTQRSEGGRASCGRVSLADGTSWQKEQFSRAYLLAVATKGGYTLASWNVDKDGVDATLRSGALMVDLQLKCTQAPRVSGNDFTYDLDVPTYNKLRDPDRSAPGYLALVVVPHNLGEWIMHEPERVLLSCHTYWAIIQDQPAPTSGKTTSVKMPRHQRLDASALEQMFRTSLDMIRRGTSDRGEAA